MNGDTAVILSRIEKLERQNRNLKRVLAAAFVVSMAIVLTVVLPAVGVDARGQTSSLGSRKPHIYKKEAPAQVFQTDIRASRLVVFSASEWKAMSNMKEEEIEAMLKFTPDYAHQVAALPSLNDKLDSLAQAVNVSFEFSDNQWQSLTESETKTFDMVANSVGTHENKLRELRDAVNVAYSASYHDAVTTQNKLKALEDRLNAFEAVACPALKALRLDSLTRVQLESACDLR